MVSGHSWEFSTDDGAWGGRGEGTEEEMTLASPPRKMNLYKVCGWGSS